MMRDGQIMAQTKDENLVTHPEMLLDDVFVEVPVNGRNDMNHEFPHGLK